MTSSRPTVPRLLRQIAGQIRHPRCNRFEVAEALETLAGQIEARSVTMRRPVILPGDPEPAAGELMITLQTAPADTRAGLRHAVDKTLAELAAEGASAQQVRDAIRALLPPDSRLTLEEHAGLWAVSTMLPDVSGDILAEPRG